MANQVVNHTIDGAGDRHEVPAETDSNFSVGKTLEEFREALSARDLAINPNVVLGSRPDGMHQSVGRLRFEEDENRRSGRSKSSRPHLPHRSQDQ